MPRYVPRMVSGNATGSTGDSLATSPSAPAPPDDVLAELRAETAALGRRLGMQVGADQGALLTLLTRLVGARHAVEVGTFTGYSSICIARGLQPGGRLLCCDVSEEYTAIARRAWAQAGVADRIELRIAPAFETLRALPAEASRSTSPSSTPTSRATSTTTTSWCPGCARAG